MAFPSVIKRRRQRTDTDIRSQSSHIEVISIIRTEPFHWVAVAEYHHAGGVWIESVTFHVTPDHATEPAQRIVHVSDTDYPGDRHLDIVLNQYDTRTMPHVILDFLLAGRW